METNYLQPAKAGRRLSCFWMIFTLLLFSYVPFAGASSVLESKKITYDYTFKANKNDQLQVDNRFGNITVTHWNKNEVSIHVVVEAKANSEKRVQQNLDRVTISTHQTNQVISAFTTLNERNWSTKGEETLTINYFIKMPSTLKIDLTQKYGNIILPEKNEGKSTINVKYGNIKAGDFTNDLDIEIKYGNGNIGSVTTATLDLGYCGNFSLQDGKLLMADVKYSHLDMQNVDKLNIENKYGNVKAEKIKNAIMEIKYGEAHIGRIENELVLDMGYSTLTAREVSSCFKRIDIEAQYGNVNLSLSPNASFQVKAEDMKYGNYKIRRFDNINTTQEDKVNYYTEVNGHSNRTINFEGNNYSNLTITGRE